MTRSGCRWKRCALTPAISYLGIGLCERHWTILAGLRDGGRSPVDIAAQNFAALSGRELKYIEKMSEVECSSS